jgi:drug/metabolite transporter (DMT)-like permease
VALSGRLLGERVRAASWIGVALGFLAVLIVARPGFGGLSVYALFPLVGAVFYALFQLLTRRLAAAGEKAETTLAWTLAVGTVIAAPLAAIEWIPLTATGWLLVAALGVVYGIAQLLLVRAFAYAPASILTPFSYAQIISATIFGLVVFGDVPDLWTVVGIVLIIAAGAYVVRSTAEV